MGDVSPHFSRIEFKCSCCDFAVVDIDLLKALEDVRFKFNKAVTINSACRCDNHNKRIGGADGSKHKLGIAADIVVDGVSPSDVYNYLNESYSDKYGLGNYNSFSHLDVRSKKARW